MTYAGAAIEAIGDVSSSPTDKNTVLKALNPEAPASLSSCFYGHSGQSLALAQKEVKAFTCSITTAPFPSISAVPTAGFDVHACPAYLFHASCRPEEHTSSIALKYAGLVFVRRPASVYTFMHQDLYDNSARGVSASPACVAACTGGQRGFWSKHHVPGRCDGTYQWIVAISSWPNHLAVVYLRIVPMAFAS